MRIFKSKHHLNWKYILGEVLLIFLGINLAIWFNNWNTSQQHIKAKKVAIEKIKGEIVNNQVELDESFQNAQSISSGIKTLKPLFRGSTSQVEAEREQMRNIQSQFPKLFTVLDSTPLDNGRFLYSGGLSLELELVELSDIAWETTKSLEVLNEFGYECLYDLEGMYSLQSRVQKEIDKSADALQKNDLEALLIILSFIEQLETQLKTTYQEILTDIDNCK